MFSDESRSAFSRAIAAWSAREDRNSASLLVKGCMSSLLNTLMTPMPRPSIMRGADTMLRMLRSLASSRSASGSER